jgi:uncharacterized protein (DUF952 family)
MTILTSGNRIFKSTITSTRTYIIKDKPDGYIQVSRSGNVFNFALKSIRSQSNLYILNIDAEWSST